MKTVAPSRPGLWDRPFAFQRTMAEPPHHPQVVWEQDAWEYVCTVGGLGALVCVLSDSSVIADGPWALERAPLRLPILLGSAELEAARTKCCRYASHGLSLYQELCKHQRDCSEVCILFPSNR